MRGCFDVFCADCVFAGYFALFCRSSPSPSIDAARFFPLKRVGLPICVCVEVPAAVYAVISIALLSTVLKLCITALMTASADGHFTPGENVTIKREKKKG